MSLDDYLDSMKANGRWRFRLAAFHHCGLECNADSMQGLEDLMAEHVAECEAKTPLTDEQVEGGIEVIENLMRQKKDKTDPGWRERAKGSVMKTGVSENELGSLK